MDLNKYSVRVYFVFVYVFVLKGELHFAILLLARGWTHLHFFLYVVHIQCVHGCVGVSVCVDVIVTADTVLCAWLIYLY